jgi:hypothetical protein
MPKVNLYPCPNPDGTDADVRVEVGWHAGHGATIATTKLRPGADRHAEYALEDDGERYRAWDGEFVDLDRRQINELIRALREARDKAFGRDE